MGDFNLVEAGFNSADETINFGARSIGCATSLFEICTLACFNSEDSSFKGVSDIVINGLIGKHLLFLTIDKTLRIFKDTEFTQILFNARFESTITSIRVTPDEKFFLICFETGVVHVFTINHEDINRIYSECLNKNIPSESIHTIDCFEEDELAGSFLIVFQNGLIFRINVSKCSENQFNVNAEEICNLNCNVTSSAYSYNLLITNDSKCNVLNVETKEVITEKAFNFKKMFTVENLLICLDKEGHLVRLCPLTLITFFVYYDFLINDFLVINDDKPQILALTKPNELGEFFLQLLTSDFHQMFSIKINYPVHFIQMDFIKNDIIFVSKITNDEKIVELRLQSVYETDPESKIKRFIKRRRFEEAEQCANMFNINPSVILKAKAQLIVDNTNCTSEDITTLLNLMDSINDAEFNLTCCANVDCSNFDDVRKILTYGSKIPVDVRDHRNDEVKYSKELMMDNLFKFDTFMALSLRGDMQSWINFLMCNLLLEVNGYLKEYRIQDAIIVYSRLDKTAINSLSKQYVEDILEVFNNLPTDLYQKFLPTFIPVTLTHFSSSLSIFVNWLLNKIHHLEIRDAPNFPENSIKLVDDIITLIRVEKNSYISFQRSCVSNTCFEDLANINEGLKVLHTLKNKFGISVQLNEYLEGAKVLIGTLVKLSMPSNEYDHFLKGFLYTYMLQNDVDPDSIFVEEINNLLKFGEDCITIIEVILKHISSVDKKLKTIKDILERSPLPWCEVTRRIVKNALQLSHPLVQELDFIYKSEPRLIVLSNPKYGIKKAYLDDEFDQVIHRIMYVDEPQMIDDIYQLCVLDKERQEASVILIQHLITMGRLDEARSVIDNKLLDQTYSVAERVISFSEEIINQDFSKIIQEYHYEMLPKLYKKLIELSKHEHEKQQHEEDFRILRGLYYFNNEFNSNFTTCDCKSPFLRKEKYQELLDIVVEHVKLASINFTHIYEYSDKISYHLSKEKNEVLVMLCDKFKQYEIIYKAGEYLFENDSDTKHLCLLASLFLKYLGKHDSSSAFETTLDNKFEQTILTFENLNYENDSCTSDIFICGLKLAEKLINKAHMEANNHEILKVQELRSWIITCRSLTRQKSTLYDEFYEGIYFPKENLPSSTILSSIRNCYEAYTLSLDKDKYMNSEYLTYFLNYADGKCKDALVHEISTLPSTIDIFCREGQHLTAFLLLGKLINSLNMQPSIDKIILKPLQSLMYSRCLPQLMYAVVSSKYIDLDLLYNLLQSVYQEAPKYLMYYLQTHKRNVKKIHDLSLIGQRLLNEGTKEREFMVNSVKACTWWRKLKSDHSNLIYEEFFKSNAVTRLKQLVNLGIIKIEDIKKYCIDFNLDADQYLKEYLRNSLINWKPRYEIKKMNGKKTVVMKEDEESLHTKYQEIINAIAGKDKTEVLVAMDKMLKEVNFYHYEVFYAIYRILENNQQSCNTSYNKSMIMLIFLKTYTRFNSPSQREKEEWYITFPDTQILDPLSEYRLPFIPILFTSEIWSILRPEISLKSYSLWFGATKMLKANLKVDDICVYAVKQVVSSGMLSTDSTENWQLYSKFEDLFNEVDKCVLHISDLERATSVVYHLMNHTPAGADKVLAAKLSHKYAKEYRNKHKNDSEVERAFIKVENKFYGLSVSHILHRFNLAEEKYLKLVYQPNVLIESLYLDERIPKYAETFRLKYSDINNAVEALSELFKLRILEIRLELLNSWLNSSYVEVDMDTTLPTVPNAPKINKNEDNLKRAVYICSSGNLEYWQSYLLSTAMNHEENDQKSLAFKSQALKCFCAITDKSTIVTMTKLPYDEFVDYINKVTLLSELESLGIFFNTESFDKCNKKNLLKKLSTIGKPLAIKCFGSICITNLLEEDKYWEYILNNCIRLEMFEELKIYVDFLKDKYDKEFYIKAWQALINKSFQQIWNGLNDNTLEELLIKNFLMIQSCPVSFSLNFEKILEKCIYLGKTEYAVLLLKYMPEEKQKCFDKDIIYTETLLKNLENLDKKGLWGTRTSLPNYTTRSQ